MKRDMVQTVDGLPPNFDAIVAVLPDAANPGVMFAYGDKVYGTGIPHVLTRELNDHERVHLERQGADPDSWWKQYLADPAFRYDEELIAHRAEYHTFCCRHINPVKRAQFLLAISKRLSSSLYGAGVTLEKAMADIREAR